ncbi:hypothetical protein [Streptomyces sp. NBC_00859]|uniref:hypothetical protein n=1 Tax=Streptomyces sp. NBC_00859 TaxID=2903682 RepID=UPI003865B1CC|nr:hypothetical protein OG584_13985 [Streptomyces sp. NBC_00859]
MNRHALPAAAALVAAAALLLTACSGSDDSESTSKSIDRTAGTAAAEAKPSSPGTAASNHSAERPKVALPPDLKMNFEPVDTSDPREKTVLSDGAERMRAINGAVDSTDPIYAALNFYNIGKARPEAARWVRKFKNAGLSITGSITYFNRHAEIDTTKSATLTFCADESKAYSKETKTGRIITTAPSKKDFILYRTGLSMNDNGVWQTSRIVSTAGATSCVR